MTDDFGTDAGSVTIESANNAPVANADLDYYSVLHGGTLVATQSVLENDYDPDGDPLALLSAATIGASGTVTWHADGTFTYVAPAGFSGVDTFQYTITDGLATATGTVAVEVLPPPSPPPPTEGWVTIETAYGHSGDFSVRDEDLIGESSDGTFTYARWVPFVVTAYVAPSSPPAALLHIWSTDPEARVVIDQFIEVHAGTTLTTVLALPIDFAETLGLRAELIASDGGSVVAYAGCDEQIVESEGTLQDITDGIGIKPEDVKNLFGSRVDGFVDQAAAALFTEAVISDHAAQNNLTEAEVRARLDVATGIAKDLFRDALEDGVDQLFSADRPRWVLRAGAGDPAAPAMGGVWSELSEAIDRAIERLRQQDAAFENLDRFVDVDFANVGQVVNDQAFQTGVSALMRTGNTGAVTDALQNKVLIDSIRFKSPILFHSASNPFDGEFSLGVSGISPDGVRGIDVHGSISTTRPFVWGAFTIEQFGFNLGITHEFGTNRPAFNAGVDFRATW